MSKKYKIKSRKIKRVDNAKENFLGAALSIAGLGLQAGSMISGNRQQKEAARQQRKVAMAQNQQGILDMSQENYNAIKPVSNNVSYAKGGNLPKSVNVNDSDVLGISEDMHQFTGASHENGGIPVDVDFDNVEDAEVEGGEVFQETPIENRIYSNKLKPSGDVLEMIKDETGVYVSKKDTFADVSKKLGEKKNNNQDDRFKGSRELVKERADQMLDVLFEDQQLQNGDSQGTNEMKYGGVLGGGGGNKPPKYIARNNQALMQQYLDKGYTRSEVPSGNSFIPIVNSETDPNTSMFLIPPVNDIVNPVDYIPNSADLTGQKPIVKKPSFKMGGSIKKYNNGGFLGIKNIVQNAADGKILTRKMPRNVTGYEMDNGLAKNILADSSFIIKDPVLPTNQQPTFGQKVGAKLGISGGGSGQGKFGNFMDSYGGSIANLASTALGLATVSNAKFQKPTAPIAAPAYIKDTSYQNEIAKNKSTTDRLSRRMVRDTVGDVGSSVNQLKAQDVLASNDIMTRQGQRDVAEQNAQRNVNLQTSMSNRADASKYLSDKARFENEKGSAIYDVLSTGVQGEFDNKYQRDVLTNQQDAAYLNYLAANESGVGDRAILNMGRDRARRLGLLKQYQKALANTTA